MSEHPSPGTDSAVEPAEGRPTPSPLPSPSTLRSLAILFWGIFLVAESTFRLFDLYRSFPPVDVPSHFLSGAALGATALWVLALRGRKRVWLPALGAVVLVSLGWEALEMIDEAVSPDPPHLQDHFFWDGVVDVLMGGAGGAAVVGWVMRRAGKTP